MPQLIIGIIIIYLYCMLIYWLFTSVGPVFIYITSLLFSIAVPVVYVRTLLRIFGRDASVPSNIRNGLFVPVVALVFLIHMDLLWLSLRLGMPHLHVPFVVKLYTIIDLVAIKSVINQEALALSHIMLPEFVGAFGRVLFSTTVKSALIIPCVLMVRGFSSSIVDSRQPARISYFHKQAVKDLQDVVKYMTADLKDLILLANKGIVVVTVAGSILVWPLTVMAYGALLPPIAIAICAALLLVGMHALSLGLIWIIAMAVSFLLTTMEKAVILSRAGYAKCPHALCHQPVPLPVFHCPKCGVEHDRLIPGRFGVIKRTCQCGDAKLPTLFWLGKGRLRCVCPSCRKPMREELFGGSVHIPIYGGPATGKTMYMMAATWELLEDKVPTLSARLIEEASDRAYLNHWKPDFEAGRVREKTTRPFPDAFLLSIRRNPGLPTSVYLYDPAGEALLNESNLDAHKFMKYFDGLALLIDPLSLPSFAARYRDLGGPDLTPTTSQVHPQETVTRVVNLLERLGKLSRRRGTGQRVAVVFTKADVPGFAKETGIRFNHADYGSSDWNKLGDDNSLRLRKWLASNEPHLYQILETRFKEMRFFAVSALGHIPHAGRHFAPRKVMEPLGWLLSKRANLARPLLGRIVGRLMEFGAVGSVLGCFVILPIWAVIWWVLR